METEGQGEGVGGLQEEAPREVKPIKDRGYSAAHIVTEIAKWRIKPQTTSTRDVLLT